MTTIAPSIPATASDTPGRAQKARFRCGVCGNVTGNSVLVAREMMFGLRNEFEYFECGACGCLQIGEVPEDLYRYYPPEYFPDPASLPRQRPIPHFFQRQRTAHLLGRPSLLGNWATKKYGRPTVPIFGQPDYYQWLERGNVQRSSRILDVGCGLGILLTRLQEDGFTDLTGIDPYLYRSVEREGLRLLKQDIHEFDETFDFIMLHHTFEHMAEPRRVFASIARRLRPGRHAVIRIPVAGCYAHRKYGANWVQLDAPRHLFLHTPRSIKILADEAGLELRETVFDSDGFQFWASEQYANDIPLRDPRSLNMHPAQSPFSPEELAAFNDQARHLNAAGEGDSACFYFFKPGASAASRAA